MKCLIVFAIAVAVVSGQAFRQTRPFSAQRAAAPRVSAGSEQNAQILRFDNEVNPDGSYNFAYETDNGIAAQEQGTPVNLGGNPPVAPVVAQGSYSYTSPEGEQISVTYTANENGFQPQSASLPVAPPVPPQIARALEYIARNAPRSK